MKTVIRKAGREFEKPKVDEGSNHPDDLWKGDLPLVPGRLPEFKVAVSSLEDDDAPSVFSVSQVCLEVCGDWSQQVIYVK
jgi:hypothetical protein